MPACSSTSTARTRTSSCCCSIRSLNWTPPSIERTTSSEEVQLGRPDQISSSARRRLRPVTAYEGHRHPVGLAHHQLRGAGPLVRDGDHSGGQLLPEVVLPAPVVHERREAGHTQGDV